MRQRRNLLSVVQNLTLVMICRSIYAHFGVDVKLTQFGPRASGLTCRGTPDMFLIGVKPLYKVLYSPGTLVLATGKEGTRFCRLRTVIQRDRRQLPL